MLFWSFRAVLGVILLDRFSTDGHTVKKIVSGPPVNT